MAVSAVLLVWQKLPASVAAYAALVALHFSTHICLPANTFLFWGAATLIAVAIDRLSPRDAPSEVTAGNSYLAVGGVAGMLIGMSVEASVMVLCTLVGTLFGQLVYCRTVKGRWMRFPSSIFIRYFCARGLKIIVAVAMLGIAVEGFIMNLGR